MDLTLRDDGDADAVQKFDGNDDDTTSIGTQDMEAAASRPHATSAEADSNDAVASVVVEEVEEVEDVPEDDSNESEIEDQQVPSESPNETTNPSEATAGSAADADGRSESSVTSATAKQQNQNTTSKRDTEGGNSGESWDVLKPVHGMVKTKTGRYVAAPVADTAADTDVESEVQQPKPDPEPHRNGVPLQKHRPGEDEEVDTTGNEIVAAIQSGDTQAVATALAGHPEKIDARDSQGYNALMHAVYHENSDMLDMLLTAKANPNLLDPEGHTVLMRAVEQQCEPCVARLMDQAEGEILVDQTVTLVGDDAVGQHYENATALSLAVTGSARIVEHLCEYLDERVANHRSGYVRYSTMPLAPPQVFVMG